jgi:hypothetical protein
MHELPLFIRRKPDNFFNFQQCYITDKNKKEKGRPISTWLTDTACLLPTTPAVQHPAFPWKSLK